MLPRKCSQPACRNIDVKTRQTRSNRAGTTPYTRMNCSSAGSDSDLLEEKRDTVEDDE